MPDYRQLHEEGLMAKRPDVYREWKRKGELQSHLKAAQKPRGGTAIQIRVEEES